jgi:hypothetical protein
MNLLSVGSIVRVIANTTNSKNNVGDIGIIHTKEVKQPTSKGGFLDNFCVNVFGRADVDNWTIYRDVELLREINGGWINLRKGDRVKIIDNTTNSGNRVGDIGMIVGDVDSNNLFKVEVAGRSSRGNWTSPKDIILLGIGQVEVDPIVNGLPEWNIVTEEPDRTVFSVKTLQDGVWAVKKKDVINWVEARVYTTKMKGSFKIYALKEVNGEPDWNSIKLAT